MEVQHERALHVCACGSQLVITLIKVRLRAVSPHFPDDAQIRWGLRLVFAIRCSNDICNMQHLLDLLMT
jgi:hypothetical protein